VARVHVKPVRTFLVSQSVILAAQKRFQSTCSRTLVSAFFGVLGKLLALYEIT